MQPPVPVLSTVTYPPGATKTQARIVIDGVRGAIFEYVAGGPLGALVSSWAATAGTDPYGNVYPAGFSAGSGSAFSGTDFIINSTGAFFYNGTPGANNLTTSITPFNFNGTDPTGLNWVIPGTTNYQPDTIDGGGYIAAQVTGPSVVWYFATSMAPVHSASPWGSIGDILVSNTNGMVLQGPSNATLQASNGNAQLLAPNAVWALGINGSTGIPYLVNGSNYSVDRSQSSSVGIAKTNPLTPTDITAAYPVDGANGMQLGATYTLKTWFNGVWGAQAMNVYADISGTFTLLTSIGGIFASGVVNGDNVNGWLEMEVQVVSGTACRIHVGGAIFDSSLNAGRINSTNQAAISSTVATGVAIALLDTIAIGIEFTATVAAQAITTEGSRFTRIG